MVNIRYHHCAYASRASMAQRDNRSDMGCFRVICNVFLVVDYNIYTLNAHLVKGEGV